VFENHDFLRQNTFTLFYGPMFAGKTSALIEVYKQDPTDVLCFKPERDTRYRGKSFLNSHDGGSIPCLPVQKATDTIKELRQSTHTVVFDEVQFFEYSDMAQTVSYFLDMGINVVAGGVDLDHLGVPFETVDKLKDWADNCVGLVGQCENCQRDSRYTVRRKGFDQNAKFLVGGTEAYKPLCGTCFQEHLINLPKG